MSRAILYGSRARGDHRDDSDVDIMLVFAGAGPDYDTQVRCVMRWRLRRLRQTLHLKDRTWKSHRCAVGRDEFDEPDEPVHNPDF